MADEQCAIELISAQFQKDFRMSACSFDEGPARGKRFDDFDLMLEFQYFGDGLSRLACAQERTGKDLIELQSEFTNPLGSQFHFCASIESQRTIFIFQDAGITQVCRDSMTHKIELNHRSFLTKKMFDAG